MTYCLAIKVRDGLVFASDSRSHAGMDHLSVYSKMFTFGIEGQRVFAVLASGNLATTQAVISRIEIDIKKKAPLSLYTAESTTEAAEYIGGLSLAQQKKHRRNGPAGEKFDNSASFIFGGQMAGREPRIFMIYPEGNFIAATLATPYLQIGEVKYGKPLLDRIITQNTGLEEAALTAMVSMDSTMRSNATVGPPIEVLIYAKDRLEFDHRFIFNADNPYLLELKTAWDQKIKEAFSELTRFNWQRAQAQASHE
ncbi:MAG: peptidase [Gammaproteobacteria bacterium]|nr:peptidase [Gammaproteobacteria bacterium]